MSEHTGDLEKRSAPEDSPLDQPEEKITLTGEKSPGVRRIEIISSYLTRTDRVFIFIGVFIIAYAYGLDGTLRYVYQPLATSAFNYHSTLATINVLRGVIAAAAQPTAAKIADVFGRVELICVSVFFYIIGTIIEATSTNVESFSAGAVIYQIGFTCVILLVEVIIADVTSLRSRVFFSFIPALPFLINTWVSGDVGSAVLAATTWRWGIGMWTIIYTASALPLIISLSIVHRRAKKAGALESYKTPYQIYGARGLGTALFWQLDVVGIILLIMVFALILVPLTLAGDEVEQWRKAKVIAPLVIGVLAIPIWIMWEKTCKHPMVPFPLLKDRAVWGALGIAVMLNTAWYLQGDFLFTVLSVAFNESIKSATRISSLYSFVSVITGTTLGLVVYYVRRLKGFIVAGTILFLVAFGLLIHYRGGDGRAEHSGIIGAQILLGFAGGLFPYPAQASIQAATKHEHVAVITSLYLASYSIGSALGNSISGAIWTNVLPKQLDNNLSNSTLVEYAFGNPFAFIFDYPIGTPERNAVVVSYRATQRILCITGICLCVPLIVFACFLRDPKLGDEQSLPTAEGQVVKGDDGELVDQKSSSRFFSRLFRR